MPDKRDVRQWRRAAVSGHLPAIQYAWNIAAAMPASAACEFIMDALTTRAPFWKRDETPDGERWVDARRSDNAAAVRWPDS
jgi:hypothetical protein